MLGISAAVKKNRIVRRLRRLEPIWGKETTGAAALIIGGIFDESAIGPEIFVDYSVLRAKLTSDESRVLFDELVAIAASPRVLTSHGLSKPLTSRSSKVLQAALTRLDSALSSSGISYFLTNGALLGFVREQRIIPNDDDIDVCLVFDTLDELEKKITQLALLLRDQDVIHWDGLEENFWVSVNFFGIHIDLFCAWRNQESFICYPGGLLREDNLFPIRRLSVPGLGAELPIPSNPRPLLETLYGESWMIPDPSHRFDWGRNRELHGEYLEFFRARLAPKLLRMKP
jgi:hypothetical protein